MDALVAAGIVPPLAALLGRWKVLRAAAPGDASSTPFEHWQIFIEALLALIAGLASRSPTARRQLRDAGAAPALRAIAVEPALAPTAVPGLCRDALRGLGAA